MNRVFSKGKARAISGALLIAMLLFSVCLLSACAPQEIVKATPPQETEAEENPATTATPPSGTNPDLHKEKVQRQLSSMTLEQKVAQLFILRPEALTGVDLATLAGETTKAALGSFPVGGIIYFEKNLIDPEQTKTMLANTQAYAQENNGLPLFLCVDEEGGTVARIGGNPGFSVPSVGNMADIGATNDPSQARTAGVTIGTYLKELGFNVAFAPDADIANNPDSQVMALRSFGSDATLVASMVQAELQGFEQTGVLACAKHFPGIGGAVGDSHNEAISTKATLDQMMKTELVPFQSAIAEKVPLIMVGHLAAPALTGNDLPASLSSALITDVLRTKLGYDGLVTTDSLTMEAINARYTPDQAAVAVLNAGADIVLMPADFPTAYQGVLDAIANGKLSKERIDQSVTRILSAKYSLSEAS